MEFTTMASHGTQPLGPPDAPGMRKRLPQSFIKANCHVWDPRGSSRGHTNGRSLLQSLMPSCLYCLASNINTTFPDTVSTGDHDIQAEKINWEPIWMCTFTFCICNVFSQTIWEWDIIAVRVAAQQFHVFKEGLKVMETWKVGNC